MKTGSYNTIEYREIEYFDVSEYPAIELSRTKTRNIIKIFLEMAKTNNWDLFLNFDIGKKLFTFLKQYCDSLDPFIRKEPIYTKTELYIQNIIDLIHNAVFTVNHKTTKEQLVDLFKRIERYKSKILEENVEESVIQKATMFINQYGIQRFLANEDNMYNTIFGGLMRYYSSKGFAMIEGYLHGFLQQIHIPLKKCAYGVKTKCGFCGLYEMCNFNFSGTNYMSENCSKVYDQLYKLSQIFLKLVKQYNASFEKTFYDKISFIPTQQPSVVVEKKQYIVYKSPPSLSYSCIVPVFKKNLTTTGKLFVFLNPNKHDIGIVCDNFESKTVKSIQNSCWKKYSKWYKKAQNSDYLQADFAVTCYAKDMQDFWRLVKSTKEFKNVAITNIRTFVWLLNLA